MKDEHEATRDVPRLALRAKDVTAATGIKSRLLTELTRQKRIPHFRIGKCVFYPVRELTEWLTRQTNPNPNGASDENSDHS